jgi:hypothetical protein
MNNPPTNCNFLDEHGHPTKLSSIQDYNKHMGYKMIKLFETLLDMEVCKKNKTIFST